MNCRTPGLPVHHQLLEFTQTHVHWVSDAIQPSHPLSSPSPALGKLKDSRGDKRNDSLGNFVNQETEHNANHINIKPHTRVLYPEKTMATHPSTLAWKIPWIEEPGRLQCKGLLRVRHDWVTSLSFSLYPLEKEMATHSSVLARRIPGKGAWWAAVYGVAQSRTRLKRLSSSSNSSSSSSRGLFHLSSFYLIHQVCLWTKN